MLINPGLLHAPNTWKLWVDYITKQEGLAVRKAALVHHDGTVAYAGRGFGLPAKDIQKLGAYLEGTNNNDKITLNGNTYIIKDIDQKHLVAFSGSKYYIITRSNTMYIIAVCESRQKFGEVVTLLKKLARRLIEKDF